MCTRSVTSLWYTDKSNCKVLSGTICNETACHKVNQQMGERELILGYWHMWSGAIPKIKALGEHQIAEKINKNSWVLKSICLIKYITRIRMVAEPKNANYEMQTTYNWQGLKIWNAEVSSICIIAFYHMVYDCKQYAHLIWREFCYISKEELKIMAQRRLTWELSLVNPETTLNSLYVSVELT